MEISESFHRQIWNLFTCSGCCLRNKKCHQTSRLQDIIHIVGDSKISMFELAKKLSPDVEPMTLNDYDGPPLPMDMSLDTVRWKKYNISI